MGKLLPSLAALAVARGSPEHARLTARLYAESFWDACPRHVSSDLYSNSDECFNSDKVIQLTVIQYVYHNGGG